jgi:hypothetical protein
MGLRFGNALRATLPSLPPEAVGPLLRYVHAVVAGLYPLAYPAPAVKRAILRPELSVFQSDFQKDLEALLAAILTSLCVKS